MGKTLILIDGHALAFRQYYALERTNMKTTDGKPTWAVFGFFKAVFDLLKNEQLQADAIAVTFDVSHQTFRVEKYPQYKSNREAMPDPMFVQMDLIKEGLQAFNIPVYSKEGFEADDVIGTITKQACELGHRTLILTGDQDAFQLVDKDDCVKVIIPSKGELAEYDWEKIHQKLGVYPDQVIDYKALRGDTSDCIPGIKGIGEKTAVMLLDRYYTLEKLLADCENIPEKAVRERVCNGKEDAKLSKFLATIVRDVDVGFDFEKTHIEPPDMGQAMEFLKKVQFYSFLKNIKQLMVLFNKNAGVNAGGPIAVADIPENGLQLGMFGQQSPDEADFDCSNTTDNTSVQQLLKELETKDLIAFKIIANVKSAVSSEVKEVALAYKTDKIHAYKVSCPDMMNILKPLLENPNTKKTTHDMKTQYNIARNHGVNIAGIEFDTMLASYIKNPQRKHDLDVQSIELLEYFINMADAADKVATIIKMTDYWKEHLDEKELKLLDDIEIPLALVLADMEYTGVCVDTRYLENLTKSMNRTVHALETEIYNLAGEGFNINSPKQVGEILFDKLGLKSKKRRGKYTTDAETLEELAQEHKIAEVILRYRKFAKLKSTYTEALPALIDPADNRIHTSYNQTVTTTGRLSSSNPNLQNIPIRTEEGSKIRQAFVPEGRDSLILSADYSQIELRLLAHVSGDKHLTEAFLTGEDVHTRTASKIFEVGIDEVTKEMRYKAKAVNFGIIYGQSKYGLAKALGITNDEADLFISKYFKTYPGVKTYMENTVKQVEETGYVETIFGRKRYLADELASTNNMIREFAKRAAINQPMQGSAADLIKMAMIDFWGKLKENGLKSQMIMQVHDEIVVELDKNETNAVKNLIKESMELGQPLSVPLVVDISTGASWKE